MEPTKKTTLNKIQEKEKLLKPKKELSEAGEQFKEIFDEHHDPTKIEQRKYLENRKARAEGLRKDLGL